MSAQSNGSLVAFATTVVTNLSPLVGVWLLGWDADSLAFVYTVEVLFAVLFAGVKALFAQQPPDYDELESDEQTLDERDGKRSTGPSDLDRRRGSVRVVGWLPPVYPRNVPFTIRWFEVTLFLTPMLLGFLARVVDPLAELVSTATVLCAASLVVSHVVTASQQYVGNRQYETVSPRSVASVPVQEAGVVFGVVAVAGGGLTATGFVVASVVVKTLVDCGQYRDGGLFGWFTTPATAGSLRTVAVPDAPVAEEIRPEWRAVVTNGLLSGAWTALGFVPFCLFLWLGILILSDGGPVDVVGVTVLAFMVVPVIVVGLETVAYVLTHGSMSYQRRGETLVASDTLTETPQWTVPVGTVQRAELSDGRLADRLFGTQSVTVTPVGVDEPTAADELRLTHVNSAARAASAFELPLATTTYEPFRLRYAAVVVALTVVTVAAEVALAFAGIGGVSQVGLVILLPFVVPMTVFGFQKLWDRAY
jgi:hypothetical protein